ncbi:MAG: helix-turn-helix domain-containing protein [Clostridium sp.]|nr:helix-turn-helix domain-containing protein [Clostridium sp.]
MDENFVRERITELRMLAKISEYQLSLELGHSKSYIQSISSGRTLPSMSAFFEICNYFNISPLEFFDKDIRNPDHLKRIVDQLKLLSEEDLNFFEEILKKYTENRAAD